LGALTLFGNLDAVLKLADWARLLVQNWKEWTHAFWLWAFGRLGIHLPPEWTPVLSFLLFGSLLTIGQAAQFKRAVKGKLIEDKYQGTSLQLVTALWAFMFTLISAIVGSAVLNHFDGADMVLVPILAAVIPIIWFAKDRLNSGLTVCLLIIFWILITFIQLLSIQSQLEINQRRSGPPFNNAAIELELAVNMGTAFVMIWVLPLVILSVAPAKAVSRRLIFLLMGLILLIALNELSKLGLDVSAPKPHG
jgi:hypothetical protein